MLRKLIIFSVCAGTSASVPILYQSNSETLLSFMSKRFSDAPPALTETGSIDPTALLIPVSGGRRVNLERNGLGHFVGSFKLNGRKVEALVDTGATSVAMNLSTARRVGVKVGPSDLNDVVRTANGDTRAAIVTIDRLDIGRISVENVQAVVLEDSALAGTLIGMSFLSRLKKFEVENDAMMLTQ